MKKLLVFFLLLALALSGCSVSSPAESPSNPEALGELKIHFIDVIHGDSTLVECNGKYMLIDAGESYAGGTVLLYLANQGVEKLDVVVSTHPHTDHMTGFASVLPDFPLGTVYRCYRNPDIECQKNFNAILEEKGVTAVVPEVGHSFDLGGATVTVVGPVKKYPDNTNNDSIVLMVEFGDTRFLLASDMEAEAERDLLATGTDLKADVLRIGHHGSNGSTTDALLAAVDPTYAVISVGWKNAHNLPDAGPIARLRQIEAFVYRTDKMGTIVAVSDGKDIAFSWERNGVHLVDKTTGLVHSPHCPQLPPDADRTYYNTLENAAAKGKGYCSICIEE